MATKQSAADATAIPAIPAVFTAMAEVRSAINKIGLAKDSEVTDGVRFKFRGIDAVLDTFSGPMNEAGLMIMPSYTELRVTERPTRNGRTFNTVVMGTYTMVSTRDGSTFPMGSFWGEANDTQDKSIAKAQSIALRQAYLQTFVVPLGAEYDPESSQQDEPAGVPEAQERPQSKSEAKSGKVADSLTAAQQRILQQKLKNAGISDDELKAAVGAVDSTNYNAAMDWIKAQRP